MSRTLAAKRALGLPGPALAALLCVAAAPPQHGGDGRHDDGGHHAHRHEGGVHHDFSDVDRWVGVFESPERDAWQEPGRVVAALDLKPGMTVADIGAGTGYFSAPFARAVAPGGAVYAADIEPRMVEHLRDRADREGLGTLVPVLCSADDPRLPAGSIDVIFICDTWHHLPDRPAYSKLLRTRLTRRGRLVIVDFKPGELPVGPPPEAKLSVEEVLAEVEPAGFRLRRVIDLPYQYVLELEPTRRRR